METGTAFPTKESEPMTTVTHPSPLDKPARFAGLMRPYPVLPAIVSGSGRTVSYDCPFCGARHRHRMSRTRFRDGRTSKQTHCAVWRRLFGLPVDSVRLFLAYDPRHRHALRSGTTSAAGRSISIIEARTSSSV